MKKKQDIISRNYLDRKPKRAHTIKWKIGDDGIITLEIENTGWANRLAQRLLGKPKVSHIHLDKLGSFVWPLMDGEKTITQLGEAVEGKFGEEAHPLYERLARYFQILDSYHFVEWSETE